MESMISRQNQHFLVYNQGNALYLLPLPLMTPVRPRLIARDYKSGLLCHSCQDELAMLYETAGSQIVLLLHDPDTGLQRCIPLLSRSTEQSYQDFLLQVIQNRLYFFYSVYTPEDDKCRLYYKMPLEQLESQSIDELQASNAANPAPCCQPQEDAGPDKETLTAPQTPSPVVSSQDQEKLQEMEETIARISTQYQELYDYTLALQKEAKKWRDLAQENQKV